MPELLFKCVLRTNVEQGIPVVNCLCLNQDIKEGWKVFQYGTLVPRGRYSVPRGVVPSTRGGSIRYHHRGQYPVPEGVVLSTSLGWYPVPGVLPCTKRGSTRYQKRNTLPSRYHRGGTKYQRGRYLVPKGVVPSSRGVVPGIPSTRRGGTRYHGYLPPYHPLMKKIYVN